MTVATTTSRVEYSGNAVTLAFSVPFYFLANADLKVYVAGVLQTITTNYSVSGAGNPAGGTVTFVSAPASGASVVIFRDPAALQETDYPPNDPFPSESHERALDKLTMIAQRLKNRADRSASFSDGYAGAANPTLPAPGAGQFLRWNVAGTALETVSAAPDAGTFTQSGAGAVARSWTSKVGDFVSVKDFGAVGDGVTDDRSAFQAAVNAIIAAGRGTVYVPSGTYLINGTTSSDSILNGVLFPWDNNYDLRSYVRIVGDGGVTIKAGNNSMVVFRVSTTFVEISGIRIDGDGKTNVTGIGVWPENTGSETITAPRSQSYFLSHSVTIRNCAIGMSFQPGVTDTSNRQSGCFYHSVYNYHGNTNTQHLVFNYPYDYSTTPTAFNQNYTTRSGFYNCSFVNGNVGIYADGVGDVYFYNCNVELINAGASPLPTPTGVYVSSQGTFAKNVQMFGGYIEACTESIFNGRTNGVVTVGTIYTTPTTGNFRNIVKVNRDGLTLAFDNANAAVNMTPTADGGLNIMADPGNAKASTIIQMGVDNVYGFALQPYLRAAGPAAPSASGNFHGFYSSDASNPTMRDYHTGSSGTLRLYRQTLPNASPNDTTSWFQFAEDATESKFIVWSNGTVQNRTGTYSAISDAKLKENVAAAPSYWGKFKAYEFVNFNFRSDPDKVKMLGVIAQQVEQVSPGLVYETPDLVKTVDGYGNEIEVEAGTTTKAVKASIMATVAQVVLQEAQRRIENIEARLSSLESK